MVKDDFYILRVKNYKMGLKEYFNKNKKLIIILILCNLIWLYITSSNIFNFHTDLYRNEIYGELFWKEGFHLYDLNDSYLNEHYDIPEGHLIKYINVTYKYPPLTLLFFAGLTGIFPGICGLQHMFLSFVLLLFFDLQILLA